MTSDQIVAADPSRDQVETVEQLARQIVAADGAGEAGFLLVFQALVNVVDGFVEAPDSAEHARTLLSRTLGSDRAPAAPGRTRSVEASIYDDLTYLQNARKLIAAHDRIVGGVPTSDFPDCVAIGSLSRWCCSGTLVAPNVVITAGHCVPRCAKRVFVGEDVDLPDEGRIVNVLTATAHPGFDSQDAFDDLAVLILAEDIDDVAPRALAGPDSLTDMFAVRLAGYGNTDFQGSRGFGRRRMVDVPIASSDPAFGADPAREFVAGAPFLDKDSCNGDSGGPAYVQLPDGDWLVAGATSRATDNSTRPCGDGGVYTRVASYLDWIRGIPEGHWA